MKDVDKEAVAYVHSIQYSTETVLLCNSNAANYITTKTKKNKSLKPHVCIKYKLLRLNYYFYYYYNRFVVKFVNNIEFLIC